MKLTGGQARGRRLRGPRAAGLRPTSARVREALFDILGSRVRGASFLDLFAGTGALGIDALSRGATRAVFVEIDRRAAAAIDANLERAGLAGAASLIVGSAQGALEALARRGERFDVIVLDPPYREAPTEELLARAFGLLRAGAVLIVEHPSRAQVALPAVAGLRRGRLYRYGDSALTVVHRDPVPEPA